MGVTGISKKIASKLKTGINTRAKIYSKSFIQIREYVLGRAGTHKLEG